MDCGPVGQTPPPPAYDYSDPASWAAFPGTPSPAELAPAGEALLPDAERPADVFFVHPTGYFGTGNWNAPPDDEQANERTGLMMGGQASAFTSACRVYAPKYRQAAIAAYGLPSEVAEVVFGTAYEDVAAAFRHYIAEHNHGRPFILASHSQGGHHMQRLLADELEQRWATLGSQFIACYMIGSRIPEERITKTYRHLKLCQSPTDIGVVIGWDTFSKEVPAAAERPDASMRAKRAEASWSQGREHHIGLDAKILGTNPYTYQTGGDAEPVSGQANLGLLHLKAGFPNGRNPAAGADMTVPMGVVVESLGAPTSPEVTFKTPPGFFTAQVDGETGELKVADPPESAPAAMRNLQQPTGGAYHVNDYTFFWANIRHNVAVRVGAFMSRPKL